MIDGKFYEARYTDTQRDLIVHLEQGVKKNEMFTTFRITRGPLCSVVVRAGGENPHTWNIYVLDYVRKKCSTCRHRLHSITGGDCHGMFYSVRTQSPLGTQCLKGTIIN